MTNLEKWALVIVINCWAWYAAFKILVFLHNQF